MPKALFPVRGDNLQQGAAFHFTKYAAFFEKWRGVRGEEKNFFSREKKFFSFPGLPSTLIGNSAMPKSPFAPTPPKGPFAPGRNTNSKWGLPPRSSNGAKTERPNKKLIRLIGLI